MILTPEIKAINEKKLVGIKMPMSILQDRTAELWQSFMKIKPKISGTLSKEVISLQLYPSTYFERFNPSTEFEKWALMEVDDREQLPSGMEFFTLESGLYAVFRYKGLSSDKSIFQYIYGDWIPNSAYNLANRPHFEVLGEKYKNNDPDSEEEIWIPVTPKVSIQ